MSITVRIEVYGDPSCSYIPCHMPVTVKVNVSEELRDDTAFYVTMMPADNTREMPHDDASNACTAVIGNNRSSFQGGQKKRTKPRRRRMHRSTSTCPVLSSRLTHRPGYRVFVDASQGPVGVTHTSSLRVVVVVSQGNDG